MRFKKLCALILFPTIVMTNLFGCGSSASEEASREESVNKADEITITMMYSGTKSTEGEDFEIDILPRLVKEKFPNINLEVSKLPDDQYYTALKTKLATGQAPDIILAQPKNAGANSVISLAKAGYLMDISNLSFMSKMGTSVNDMSYDGKIYAVPGGIGFLATYYNKDMFEDNGLNIPTNWEEFLNCCEVLKNAGIQPIVMGDKDSYVMQFGLYQLAANQIYPENDKFDDELGLGESRFTDGEWDKVLEMYYTLYEKGYIANNSLGLGAAQAIQKFIDGEAAMTFDGSFNAAALCANGAKEFERGMFPLPANDKGKEVYTAGATTAGPAIFSGTEYPEECKAILEYWFDENSEVFEAYCNTGKTIVTYGGAEYNPLFENCMETFREGRAFYWCNQAWPAGVESEMQAKFGELIGGQKTKVSDITKAMQEKFEELYTE